MTPPQAIRLIQGYLWHPQELELDLEQTFPLEWEGVSLLWDEIRPPFAFFENGTLSSTQTFYQFTALELYAVRPSDEELHQKAERLSKFLGNILEATPPGFGWQLLEDLRPLE